MKAYFEPKINISVFDTENVITTSNNGGISEQLGSSNQYGVVDYSNLGGISEVSATTNMTK